MSIKTYQEVFVVSGKFLDLYLREHFVTFYFNQSCVFMMYCDNEGKLLSLMDLRKHTPLYSVEKSSEFTLMLGI